MLVVRFASLFDVKNRTVTFLGGKKYSMEALRAMGAGDLLNSMFDFSEKLMNLGLSEEEMSLFTAVVLVSAGEPRPPPVPDDLVPSQPPPTTTTRLTVPPPPPL